MSRTYHKGDRRIRVRGVRKDPPDLRRLARALIEFAQAEQEAAAEADHETKEATPPVKPSSVKTTTINKTNGVESMTIVTKKGSTNTSPLNPGKDAA
jgi:hypothetical protein